VENQEPYKKIYLQNVFEDCDMEDKTWCQDQIADEDVEYILMSEYNKLQEKLHRYRWIPISEQLPEFIYGSEVGEESASAVVEVAYRYPNGKQYYSRRVQFWRKYGWLYEFNKGKPITFEDYGFVIDFWRELMPLPEPPKDEED